MNKDELSEYAIVADIGGTFARFGRVHITSLALDRIEVYRCATFSTIESAFQTYQAQHHLQEIQYCVLAIACPIVGDLVRMTNCPWQFSIKELKQHFNFTEFKVINDFMAIAMSVPILKENDFLPVGGERHAQLAKVKVILGAGTGLGVAYLIPDHFGNYTPYGGEGGHVDWGAKTEQEWFIHHFLKRKYGHVSYERVLSGLGLENLYQAIALYRNCQVKFTSATEIIDSALAKQCNIAQATVDQFLTLLSAYGGDLALTFGALGGVYFAGGIIPRLLSMISPSKFRCSFEDKGRFHNFNQPIPTYIITAKQPGMLGAGFYLKQSLRREADAIV